MTKAPSAALKRALASSKQEVPEDKLEDIRNDLRRARDLEMRSAQLMEQYRECQDELQTLLTARIPEKFEAVFIDKLGLLPEGNLPGYDAQLRPYYRASIPADWPEEKREKAFAYLEDNDAGDLIGNLFSVSLGRGTSKQQERLRRALQKTGVAFTEKKAVNWNTLTAWVKEQIEKHQTMPDLETLGAKVGKIINLKPRKES